MAACIISNEWTIHLAPQEGELFSSWICRLARSKCFNPNHLYKELKMHHKDIDINPYQWLIIDLINHTRISRDEIKIMLLDEWEKLFREFKKIDYFYGIVGRPNYRNNGIRICPLCLKEDTIPFYRKLWRVGAVTACLKHNCLLVDRCPNCGSYIDERKVKWEASFTSCFKCGFELADAPVNLLSTNDPCKEAVKELSSLEYGEKYYKVLTIASLLSKNSSLNDPFYNDHPLIKDLLIKELFNGDRKKLFLYAKSVYLVIGISWSMLNDGKQLDYFLRQNNSCLEHFWTNRPYCCHLGEHDTNFKTIINLDHNSYAYGSAKPHICLRCGHAFNKKKLLENHLETHKKDVLTFSNKQGLMRHLNTHKKEKGFICPICKKGFAEKTSLRSHSRIHTDLKPYQCQECGKTFKWRQAFREHTLSHSVEGQYICSECGKKFRRLGHLNSHEKIHDGERSYECPECGKRFRHKTSLNYHKQIHTGEKPYECQECGKKFRNKSNLNTHKRIHTKEC